MDVLTGLRLIRENSFQTTREVLQEAEDTIQELRDISVEALQLANQLWYAVPDPEDANGKDVQDLVLKHITELTQRLEKVTHEDD